jgi:hypothetical protein
MDGTLHLHELHHRASEISRIKTASAYNLYRVDAKFSSINDLSLQLEQI